MKIKVLSLFLMIALLAGCPPPIQTETTVPTGVLATAGDARVTVSWNAVSGAKSYNLYTASQSGVTKINYDSTLMKGTRHLNVNRPVTRFDLTNETPYYFVITAVTDLGEGAESAEVSATPSRLTSIIPAAPMEVSTIIGNLQATIVWTTVPGAATYNLYMAEQPGINKTNFGTLLGGMRHVGVTSPLVHTNLTNGKTYYFVVTAVNAIGEGPESNQASVTPTAALVPVPVALTAGHNHSCALTISGGVKCWGLNDKGQVGDNSTTMRLLPVSVVGLATGVRAISAGSYHSCAVMITGGGVKCWGENGEGELGNGTTTSTSTPVDVVGLANVVAINAGGSHVSQKGDPHVIIAGGSHSCALMNNGTAKCWGSNRSGELGNGTTASSTIPVDVVGLTNIVAIASGGYHSCAITSVGGVKCWGKNDEGQLGSGTTTATSTPVDVVGLTSGVIAIVAGGFHTCAIMSGGAVKCWGNNYSGELGNGMSGATTNSTTPVNVVGLTGATAIVAGELHTCALTSDSRVKCWGNNYSGELGNTSTLNTQTGIATPIEVAGVTDVVAITAGGHFTFALTRNNGVKGWGYNHFGALGDGLTNNGGVPTNSVLGL